MSGSIAYRADVDGLRAVAVLSVILCHFGVPGFWGGYVGVDVFFVISGFLITSIVLRDIAAGGYSLAKFYERRARRILPAFAVVALFTSCAALALFLPEDLIAFGKSLLASAVFSTNLLFWQEGGYFAAPSELKPLLHTWSLSIEEQFYVFFPLLLSFLSQRAPRLLRGTLGLLLIASLALCVWATGRREFAFYLLPSRAWELATGAILAVFGRPASLQRAAASAVGLTGLVGVVVAVLTFTSGTAFPGIAAALPCFGAAAIILSGPSDGPVASLLSRSAPVFVGKISYSLYLWHWPLLVFAKYYLARSLTGTEIAALLALTLALATLSWRFVETPFRRGGPGRVPTAKVLGWGSLCLSMVGAAGGALWLGRGLPGRVPARVLAIAKLHHQRYRARPSCVAHVMRGTASQADDCRMGTATAMPTFALWGDSHAAAVSGGVAREASRAGRAGLLLSTLGCPPLVGVSVAKGTAPNGECRAFSTASLRSIENEPSITRVLLVGRWSLYVLGQLAVGVDGADTQRVMGGNPLLLDPRDANTTPAQRAALLEASLRDTCEQLRLKGKRVFVSDPLPEVGWDVPMTLARLTWFQPGMNVVGPSATEYRTRNRLVLEVIERLAQQGVLTRLTPEDWLCRSGRCALRDGDNVLYADADHVSREGADLLAPAFLSLFAAD